MKRRVLVVEDDPALQRVLRDNLTLEGLQVECVSDGAKALQAADAFAPDLILLDLMLPNRNGYDLCAQWRKARGAVPIIMVTARGSREDKLRGLDIGADDYVTKPFDLDELLARVRAVLRRYEPAPDLLRLGSVRIDFRNYTATRDGAPLDLTYREYELLHYLAGKQRVVVRRDELLRHVWGYREAPDASRAVDHAIARLRRKIEADPRHPKFIQTVHADGYYLTSGA